MKRKTCDTLLVKNDLLTYTAVAYNDTYIFSLLGISPRVY